jgi:Fe-S cluster assembly protein SufD
MKINQIDAKNFDHPYVHIDHNKIRLKKNSQFNEPLVIFYDQTTDLHITVESSTEVEIILESNPNLKEEVAYTFTLDILDNAKVNLVVYSDFNGLTKTFQNTINLYKFSELNVIGAYVSEKLISDLVINLKGEQANVMVHGVALSKASQEQTVDVHMTFYAPHSFGDMYQVGIAKDSGKLTLNGVEKIEQGMKQANAFQTLKGVILSDNAIVNVNPILLIDEFDVKAGHGATIGKIESEQLYYLQSRGLTKQEAEKMIVHGFIKPIIDHIKDETIQKRIENKIFESL